MPAKGFAWAIVNLNRLDHEDDAHQLRRSVAPHLLRGSSRHLSGSWRRRVISIIVLYSFGAGLITGMAGGACVGTLSHFDSCL